ncbi:MAG: PAS domain S-box protein [Pseudomonadales bacterium]|nr:PAS domain S-box protein [Pseudomonadales bacterium]
MTKRMNIRVLTFVAATGLICLILMLQTCLVLYVNYYQLEHELRNELFRDELSDAIQFKGIIEHLLQKHEFEQLQEEIVVMGVEPAVSKAVVIDNHHIVLASTIYADKGKTFQQLFPELLGTDYETLLNAAQKTGRYRTLQLDEVNFWVLFQPIVLTPSDSSTDQQSVGFLVKKIDLSWIGRQARSSLLERFLPTLFPLVLGAFLFAIIAYYLHTRRLTVLGQLFRDIAVNGLDFRSADISGNKNGLLYTRSNKFIERKQRNLTSVVEQIALREQGLSLMLHSIADAVIVTDTEERIVRMNPVAEDITSCKFKDAEGQFLEKLFSVIDTGTREKMTNPVAEALSTGKTVNLSNHTLVIPKNGQEYQISDSAAPIINEADEIVGVILVFRDVTETFRLQQSIFERNQLLEAVMNNMPALLYIKDIKGRFLNVNRSFEGAFEIKNDDVVGKTDQDLFDKDMADDFQGEDQKVIDTGETISWQNEAKSAEGLRKYLTIKFPLYDLNDEIYAVCGMSTDITDQIRLLKQLEESKKNLQAIIDHAPAVIYIRDLQGHFLLANKNLSEMMQMPLEEIVGQNSYDVMDSDSADQHLQHEKIVIESGMAQEFIEQFPQKDGVHHFLSVKYPLFDENNNIYAVGGIGTDITERFKLEQSIRKSEQHMRLYRDQNPLAFIEWNPRLEVVDWNPAAEKLFGYSKAEALGRTANELILPEHLHEYIDALTEVLISQSGGESSFNENVTRAGKLIYCQWQNTPITDESGIVVGVASLIRDMSEQQKMEEELKAQEVEQHQILNHIVDGVITIDESGTILSFNHSAETLFGYGSEEVIGSNINMLMPEPDRSQHDSYLHSYVETGTAKVIGFNRVVRGQRKNSDTFSMRLSVAELPVSVAGRRRFVGSCMDVTELEQRELQLQQIQKMEALGKLTGGIAHDYNNMLGVILGYVDLLEGKLKQPDVIRYVKQIQKAGQRGANLTSKLLSFSRKKAIESEVVDINLLLEEERDMLQKTLTPRIELRMDLQDEIWPVWIDKGEFEDALLNLSINAMDAMRGTGKLKLSTANQTLDEAEASELGVSPGDYIAFAIEDSGCGMSAAVSSRVFDPFFSTKGESGTGLGLSQVYGFVQRSNGAIWIDSLPSLGSRFELFFPRYFSDETKYEVIQQFSAKEITGDETILIVDDEPAIRDISRELLTDKGYKVLCVGNGKEALEVLQNTDVDLLISDVIMPGMDGYQLARKVKLQFPHVKIQLVSGFTGDYQPDEMDLNLQQSLLTKPVGSVMLLQRIRWLLDENE